MHIIAKIIVCLLLLTSTGCASGIRISSLMQQKRHHEVIRILQPTLDQHKPVTSFELLLLTGSYYEIRDYDNMLTTAGLLERQIAGGDNRVFGADLSVYPAIMRGYVYLDQGEMERAVSVLTEAHRLLEKNGEPGNGFYRSQLIDVAGILGIAHANLGHDGEAQRYLGILQGINISGSILGPEKYIAIAKIQMARKQYREALAAVRNPEAGVSGLVAAFYDQTFQDLPKFFILTKCLYETGQFREAKENYDQLLKHPQIREVGGLYWPVLLDRARIARTEGDNRTAEGLLREAIDVVEKQRATIRSEAGRIGYVGDKQDVYQELITLLVAAGRPAEAFEYVERAKGRALVDLMATQKRITPRAADPARVEAVYQELARAEHDLAIVAAPGTGAESNRTRGLVVALKKDMTAQAPEFTALIAVSDTTAAEIRARLAPDETLVEYYAAGKEWFVFVLSRSGIAVKRLGPLDLERDIQAFRAALTDPATIAYQRLGRELYDRLVAPVAGLMGTGRVTIVPHGPLHYLPFGALLSHDGFLVDRAAIRILQSASVLKFLKNRPRQTNPRVLILGNPDLGDPRYDLTYAQDEAQAIARIMPGATLLTRERATASYVSRNADRFTMIHFAAHGLFMPDDPLGSALLLAADGTNDGRLRAGDLYNLNLNADLVTLSACETGLGKITKGDDVVGFTRGLLYAGADAIVSTLWKVDDRATRELMLAFYGNLRLMDKGEALHQAQLVTKQKYPHPFFWASFQLTGSAR